MVQNNYRTAVEGKHVAAADPPQAERVSRKASTKAKSSKRRIGNAPFFHAYKQYDSFPPGKNNKNKTKGNKAETKNPKLPLL